MARNSLLSIHSRISWISEIVSYSIVNESITIVFIISSGNSAEPSPPNIDRIDFT